ncbi:hypothetical protein BGZ95_002311 [Linnemannia exigua]|uniref:Uncharacterized protein n=1 Tax=Linnemannia exigua TaxID=604196 RepID=A0AAD4DIT6_9FUNG|nr:hypothetical protein BGZ95_002311 [Linnemannia exigua]
MSLHSPLDHQQQQHFRQQQQHQSQTGGAINTMAALKLAAAVSFFSSANETATATATSGEQTTTTRSPAAAAAGLYPISTTIPSPVHHSISTVTKSLEQQQPHTIMVNANGSTQPFAFQPPQSSPTARSHTQQKHHQHHNHHHHHISSLPSPPLSSVEPPLHSGFFPKSPLQERCEALETELSALRTRLKRSERSSTLREKRLSIFQQQSTDSQQSLHSLKTQYDTTFAQLQQTQRDLISAQSSLSTKEAMVRHLEAMTEEQESQLKEVLTDREAMTAEMMESHAENAKQQKRLKSSTDKVEKLQQENRQLIDQLRELRAKVVDVSDAKLDAMETLSREKARDGKTIQELEKESTKNRIEIDRLQELVMNMGNRHVQVQAQLSFFQQQAIQLQQQLDLSMDNETTGAGSVATKHSSVVLADGALSSLLSSVATVATTSLTRRSKPTRRFTVNAPRKVDDLTMEQRKCQFLMDQIAVLQRGYDSLRQEKVTLELQIDLMQRQHQYHQQQRQKRRESQRRTLGHEQSVALANSLAILVKSPSSQSPPPASSRLSAAPSTPLLPTISAAEQEREKARIQHELEQAQIRAQQQAQEQELQRQAAKVAAEEAEREAIRLRRAKSIHLKETLASLESRRGRSDSRDIQFSPSEELKHLEHLRLASDDHPASAASQQQQMSMSQQSFQNAAAARASRRIGSPLSMRSMSSSPLAMSSPSSGSSPSSSSSKQSSAAAHYTHSSSSHRAAGFAPTYSIEQCSCCIGNIIEL